MQVPIFIGNGQLIYEERPIPIIQSGQDVLVRIEACGICGTDLNILAVPPAHKANTDIAIGHEGIGYVVELGSEVHGLQLGDRVVIAPRLTCGKCAYCRRGLDNQCSDYQTIGTTIDGAFAPYLVAPARALFRIHADVPRDDAVFFEPLSCVVGAVRRAAFQPGDNILVIGGGPMGLLFAQVYRSMGAGKIIIADMSQYRLDFAHEAGADLAINVRETDLVLAVKQTTGLGADIVVDAVGNQLDSALHAARRGGQVILFGLRPLDNPPVNQYTITRYDLTVHGAFVGLYPFVQTIQLLESGRIKPSMAITHRLPLSELQIGVELMRTQQAMKVIIEMPPTK